MSDDKPGPDELTKTTDDDISLTEQDMNEVSGGYKESPEPFLKIDYKE